MYNEIKRDENYQYDINKIDKLVEISFLIDIN